MLKIAVCIKQIPLVEDANFDPVTKTIRRDGEAVISAFDLRAIAVAVELKQRLEAETVAVTMGPPQARAALVDALAMGLDRAVHLEDRAFAGADTLATARALALYLKREGFDLVLTGKYSLDAETGQVGPEVAELMGIPQVTGVRKLELSDGTIRAERESDEGFDEVECRMPALVTCAERLAQPIRLRPEAKEAGRLKPVVTLRATDLDPDPAKFGFAGSPTWVQEIRLLENPKTRCRFIDGSDPVRAAQEVLEELDRMGALEPRALARRLVSDRIRTPVRGRDLWVVCETTLAGAITRGTLELLSRGDELATRLGGALFAVGFPGSISRHARLLAGYGADRIVAIDHPALEPYTPEVAAAAIASLITERTPWGVLLGATERGRDFGPRLAARLGLGLTGDAIGIDLDTAGRMVALKPAFGGNVVAPIMSKTFPQMATVRPGILELAEPLATRQAEVETVQPVLGPALSRLVGSHSLLDSSLVALEGAEIVVGVGSGVGGPEGVGQAKTLARVLSAAMCATRRVTDAGWMPRQLQVGLTGKAIDPRLYFALAIRGVPNHVVGIKRAQFVVAINNDERAAIFERADLGIVADWAKIVPALADAFRERGGRRRSTGPS